MSHLVRLHDTARASGGRSELVCPGHISPSTQAESALAAGTFSAQFPWKNVILGCGLALFLLFICTALLCVSFVLVVLDLRPVDFRPGIGAPEHAEIKIKPGMTKDEVRALLGRPHSPRDGSERGPEWTYRCDFFGAPFSGSISAPMIE